MCYLKFSICICIMEKVTHLRFKIFLRKQKNKRIRNKHDKKNSKMEKFYVEKKMF